MVVVTNGHEEQQARQHAGQERNRDVAAIGTPPELGQGRGPRSRGFGEPGGSGRGLTFAEVGERATRLGSALRRVGLVAGDRVALLAANEPEYLEMQAACLRSGYALVPINTRLTDREVLFILDEFAALRDMPFMREAVAQMRSSGAWFWFFVQDVAQLESIYGDAANVFLSQTDHQVFFGSVSDAKTRAFISKNLGTATFAYRDAQLNWSQSIGVSDGESAGMQAGSISSGRNVGQSINVGDPVVLAPKQLLTPFEVGTVLGQRRPGETHPSVSIMFSKQAGGFPLLLRRRHWKAAAGDGTRRHASTLLPVNL